MFNWIYLFSWLIAYFLLSLILYYGDVAYGIWLYRFYFNHFKRHVYNWLHQDRLERLPCDSDIGFLHHQKALRKASFFATLSLIQSIWMVVSFKVNPVGEIIAMILEAVVGFVGLIYAPRLMPWWLKRKKAFEVLDKIDKDGIKSVMQGPIEKVKHKIEDIKDDFVEAISGDDDAPTVAEAPPAPQAEQKPSPDDLINAYVKRR